jgi:hypothetical protein
MPSAKTARPQSAPARTLSASFDSALCRKPDAEWHFYQENATLHDFKMATVESKPL